MAQNDDRAELERLDADLSGAAKNLPMAPRALALAFWRRLLLILLSLIDRIEKLERNKP